MKIEVIDLKNTYEKVKFEIKFKLLTTKHILKRNRISKQLKEQKGRTYSNGEAMLNRDENDAEEGTKHHNEIELVDLPNAIGSRDVDKADDGGDDDGSQHQIGCILKQRHQKQQRHHYRH